MIAPFLAAALLLFSDPAPEPWPVHPISAPDARMNHAATIAVLPDGVLACWYAGSSEAATDVRIVCARGDAAGLRWGAPQTVVAPGGQARGSTAPNKSLGNPVLTEDAAGRLWLIYGVIQERRVLGLNLCRNWVCGRIDAQVSQDGGRTWSAPQRFDDSPGALPRAKPAHDPQRGDIMPFYLEGPKQAYLAVTDLTQASPAAAPVLRRFPLTTTGLIQPALIRQGGLWRAYFRDTQSAAVYTATFDPARLRWSDPVATNLPNPNAAIDVFDEGRGRIVLIYNPSVKDRRALAFAVSGDGVHFAPGCRAPMPPGSGDVAYPSVARLKDGAWLAVFSAGGKQKIMALRFDAKALDACLSRPPSAPAAF